MTMGCCGKPKQQKQATTAPSLAKSGGWTKPGGNVPKPKGGKK